MPLYEVILRTATRADEVRVTDRRFWVGDELSSGGQVWVVVDEGPAGPPKGLGPAVKRQFIVRLRGDVQQERARGLRAESERLRAESQEN
jgi:hypothetical protein